MKIRSIHPGFFSDRKLSQLPYEARLLYAGLWCHSDDYGRGQYLPKAIEGAVFPNDPVDIVDLLLRLEKAELIRVYEADEEVYYEISKWEDYQSPKYRAKTSVPEPDEGDYRKNPIDTHPGLFGTKSVPNEVEVSQEFVSGEGEGEGEGEGVELLAPKAARDRVWDTLAEIFGEPTTRTNRSLRGKLVKSLSSAGATRDGIVAAVVAWPLHFPDATLTETALEKHWDRLARPPARASRADVERYENELHLAEGELRARRLDGGLPA